MKKNVALFFMLVIALASLGGFTALAESEAPSVEIEYYTVPMTATVEILYAVSVDGYAVNPDGSVDGLYLYVWKGTEGTLDTAAKISSQGVKEINGKYYLVFVYDGLNADEMDVKAYAKVFYNGRSGATKSYSVKDFASSYSGEHTALVDAMIKYGDSIKALSAQPVDVNAEIVNKDGTKGVLTLVSDDGDQRTSDFFYTELVPAYNCFKITVAMPTKKIATLSKTADGKAWLINEDGNYALTILDNTYSSAISGSVFASNTAYPTTVDFWKKITSTGQIELASHSHTHDAWGVSDDVTYKDDGITVKYPAGNVIKELHASAQILRDLLGQESHFILRPGGHTDLTSEYFYALVAADDTFIGMRSSNGAPPLKGVSSANAAKLNTVQKFTTSSERLKIATILVRAYEAAFNASGTGFATTSDSTREDVLAAGISAWEQYVDYAMEYGSWASIGFHSVVSDDSTATGYAVYDSQVKALMDYVEPLVESGDLWLASFADAAKYYFEWSSANVEAKAYGDSLIKVKLTDGEDDPRFDEALTVKVSVPSDWTSCRVDFADRAEFVTVRSDASGSFVYVNIVPGEGIVTLASAN